MSSLFGRDEERASLERFIGDGPDHPTALVLAGEAGIGKSALWWATVASARERGIRVLSARPVEAEQTLSHAGLADLLAPVADDILHALLPPRRRALEAVLLIEEEADPDVDLRALGVAVRDVLALLSVAGPIVLAIDDLPWFDAASMRALGFALRRLERGPVRLLATERGDGEPGPSPALEALRLPTERLHLGPLSVAALHGFLRDRLGRSFPRPILLALHERSAGNPFYALELARAVEPEPGAGLPTWLPATLTEVVGARLTEFPAATREALGFVAALGAPQAALLTRVGVDRAALDVAEAAEAIVWDGDTVRFAHPLLATAAYAGLTVDVRRRVHARLAEALEDPVLRAGHIARVATEPQAELAAELDRAAGLASDRGDPAAAAELADHALRLTQDDADETRERRMLAAARAHQSAGHWMRADALTAEVRDRTSDSRTRADALVLLAELGSADRAVLLLAQALDEPALGPGERSSIHTRLAWATRFQTGYVAAIDHARAALELAEGIDDPQLGFRAQLVHAVLGWMVGAAAPPELGDVREFVEALGGERLVQEALLAIVNTQMRTEDRAQVRADLERQLQEWAPRDEPLAACVRWGLAWLEFWAGNWALAAEHATGAYDIAVQYGLETPQDHLPIAIVSAHLGQRERARWHAERALELAAEQFGLHPPQHLAILGVVALGEGEAPVAAGWFDKAQAQAITLGLREPSLRWWTPIQVEVLLELGRVSDATSLLDAWEADARDVGRSWFEAHAMRCRALCAAALGDVDAAIELLERSITAHVAVGDRFGEGQALLALGAIRRRARSKRPAREALEAALDRFEIVGAIDHAARARRELGTIGGRTRQHDLTPAERRVAELVAEGRTNREVATALFLSPRTVASHLTRVYAKLGVRSRTELARRLIGDDATGSSKVTSS